MAIPKKTIFKYDISQKYTIPTGVAGRYVDGKPTWTVTHSSGNPNASVDSEINYMTNNYKRAFTHDWVGHNKIVEIANTDYPCWGAGPTANARAVQIEVTEDKNLTNKQKLQAIDRQAFYIAVQHVYYEIPLSRMYSHADISAMYPNDTDHTDPIAFFKKAGTTWTEYKNQVHAYYGLLVSGGDTRRVVSIADKKGDKAVIKSAEKEAQKNHSKNPDKDGKTKLFKVGDKVKLTDKASHWHKWYDRLVRQGGTRQMNGKIADHLKNAEFKVTYLNANGTVELAQLIDDKQQAQRYVAYEWDIEKDDSLYKVQTGAFSRKENAEKKADELKKQGHETYITKD